MALGGGLDRRDVELELDLVGHGEVAAAEDHVELHAVVAAAELAADVEADAAVAERGGLRAAELGLERDRLRDAVHREVAGDLVGVLVDGLEARRLERDLRVALDVEEVGGLQVAVAVL